MNKDNSLAREVDDEFLDRCAERALEPYDSWVLNTLNLAVPSSMIRLTRRFLRNINERKKVCFREKAETYTIALAADVAVLGAYIGAAYSMYLIAKSIL